jgi:hypothetical protein
VELKIRGEAKTRTAEEAFVTELQKNQSFTQVILERETDRQGGGVEFEYTLPVAAAPPPFVALPKYGPPRTVPAQPLPPKPAAQEPKSAVAIPAPVVKPMVVPATRVEGPPLNMAVPRPLLRGPANFDPNLHGSAGQPPDSAKEERP